MPAQLRAPLLLSGRRSEDSKPHSPFASGPLQLRQYLLDSEHSSSYSAWLAMDKPAQPTSEQWSTLRDAADLCYYDRDVEAADGAVSITFPLRARAVSLVTLRP